MTPAETIGVVSTVLGILGTLFGWWKFAASRRKTRDQVRTLQAVGDRIAQTADLEGEGYERAIAEYEKALALDAHNVEVYRRTISATRRKLELEPPVRLYERECQQEIHAALTRMYEFQASHAALKDDRDLLLEEAALLELGGKPDTALGVLKKAHAARPDDAEVLARLGLLSGDLGLIGRAIESRKDEASYHYYLAQVLDKQGRKAEAVRAYRRAAELASGSDIWSRRTHNGALNDLLQVFKSAQPDMPAQERVQALEYFRSSRKDSLDPALHFLLATLYHPLGELEKAHAAIRKALGDDKGSWKYRLPMLKLFATILEEGRFDPATLAEVQAILREVSDGSEYEQLLEIGKDKGHRYKIGLKVEKESGNGVLVLRTFEGYPFARAGVRDGDRILEFAHRKIRSLRDICLPLIEFTPGTDVPLKVQRADELLDLTLIIQ